MLCLQRCFNNLSRVPMRQVFVSSSPQEKDAAVSLAEKRLDFDSLDLEYRSLNNGTVVATMLVVVTYRRRKMLMA